MGRKMSKRDFLKEFGYTERAKHIKDATQLEIESKRYAKEHGIEIKGWGNNYQTTNLKYSVDYTEKLLGTDDELGQLYGDIFSRNNPDFDGFGKKKGGNSLKKTSGNNKTRSDTGRKNGSNWANQDYFPGMISFYKGAHQGTFFFDEVSKRQENDNLLLLTLKHGKIIVLPKRVIAQAAPDIQHILATLGKEE